MTRDTGYRKLALQVIARGCEAKDQAFLRSEALEFWCKVAGIDAQSVREANREEGHKTSD